MVLETDITMIAVGDPMDVLINLNRAINQQTKRGSKYIANAIKAKAREYVPKDTRNLMYSIDAGKDPSSSTGFWHVFVDNYRAPYGIYVEYGTSKMPAKPFMRPAIDSVAGAQLMSMAIWEDPGLQAVMHKPVVESLSRRVGGVGGWLSKAGQPVLGMSNLASLKPSPNFGFSVTTTGIKL